MTVLNCWQFRNLYLRFLFTRALTLASTRTSSRQHLLKERNNVGNMKTGAGWLKILRSDVFVTLKVTNSTFKIGPGLSPTHLRAKIMCGLSIKSTQQRQPTCLLWSSWLLILIQWHYANHQPFQTCYDLHIHNYNA